MNNASNQLRPITENPDMGIILSDGCRLSARVWMPEDAASNPVPVILEYLPYRKRDGTTARDSLTHPYFAKRGYACVRVDMRGNGDSQGLMDDEYSPQELSDAVEVINWLASQPWCSGTVGMMGISWGGFNSLQVAALQPEALKAIITLCSTADRYADDIHFKGGCLLNENLGWGATMWAYSSRPPDPALVGENWRDMWRERLEAEPFLPAVWLKHQRRDEYWKHGSVCEDFSAIKAATLAVGGWGDSYKNTVPILVENLSAPVKGIVGPWVHKYPHFAVPEPRIGFLQEALRWWDKWLKGVETGVEDDPAMSMYLMDGVRPKTWYTERAGRWITEADWPSTGFVQTHHFQSDHTLGPMTGQCGHMIASPQNCGRASGEFCAIWLGPEMPGDQRGDDAYSVCYTSEPVSGDTDIVGAAKVRLTLKSGAKRGQIAVRLNHVHPDGASTRVTYGVLNLSHRNSHEFPEDVPVGTPFDVTVQLDDIAYRIPKGHRLRIAISSSYWPLLWPQSVAADLSIIAGQIDLPLRSPAAKDERAFPPPDADDPWETKTIRKPSHVRRFIDDQNSGVETLEIIDDFGLIADKDHGLVNGTIAREWWSIHPDDPLSARGKTHWTTQSSRGSWDTRTETYAEMWSDATHFHFTAKLEAYENNELFYQKSISESMERDHM